MLAATVALGLTFPVVKGFDYASDIDKHLGPGSTFKSTELDASQF